jgi:tellurite resistance protein TerC
MDQLLFPWSEYWWVYAAFVGFVAIMLALDLGVFHRKAHVIGFKEATFWSIFWIGLALGFAWAFGQYTASKFDPETSHRLTMEFLTGFVVEKALAVDNIFVFVLVFSSFGIPAAYQHRVLFFGILGAIFFRALFIAIGARLMEFHWVVVFFGVFLIATGIKMMLVKADAKDPA